MTYNTQKKTRKEKITRISTTIIRHGGLGHMALSLKRDSLALRTESREE